MASEDTAPSGDRPLLFVSYSRGDLPRARPVIDLLEQAGFDPWWDGRLEGGENYLKTTEAALENAAAVVVLWSQTSVDSHWVRDEGQRGRERECLVPLTIDGTMAPLGFRQFQLLDISTWDGSPESPEAERILVAVRAKAGAAPEAPVRRETLLRPPAPTSLAATPPAPASPGGPGLSRRTLIIGGVGLAGGAGLLGAWQFGIFGSPANAAISMVVLPFRNETGDPDKKYFSDGIARELRMALMRNPRLKVAAPTSSSAIEESEDDFAIGSKLGVGHILRGSVQRAAARMRVMVELVAIKGGEQLWADKYDINDRALEDIFAVQSDIAQKAAISLVVEVASVSEAQRAAEAQQQIGGTTNVAAYEAFLRGHALYDLSATSESDRAALAQFDAAIAADPDYASAHAMRSTMLATLAINLASGEGEHDKLFDAAIAASERALAIEPRLARGHLSLGYALSHGRLDLPGALPHYRAAEENAAGDADILRAVASYLAYGEDPARARTMIAEVLARDPLNARAFRTAGYISIFARQYAEVITRMERALALNPSIASVHFGIAIARLMQGDPAGALKAAEAEPSKSFALTAAAIARHQQGDKTGAEAALAELARDYDGSFYQQAEVHAQMGQADAALALLEDAYAKRDSGLLWLRNDPLLDPLRSAPQFADLLKRLGS